MRDSCERLIIKTALYYFKYSEVIDVSDGRRSIGALYRRDYIMPGGFPTPCRTLRQVTPRHFGRQRDMLDYDER